MMTVVITWMDGPQETYHCDDAEVINNVLWLSDRVPRGQLPQPARRIPLCNVRIWTVEQ